MKKKKIALIITASMMSLLTLVGCASSFKSGAPVSTYQVRNGYYAEDGEAYEGADVDSAMTANSKARTGSLSGAAARKTSGMEETQAAAEAPAPAANGNNSNQANVDPTKGRLLIRNVAIVAETTAFDSVRQSVEDKVKALGGYIENSGVSGTGKKGSLRSANYVIRVPADGLDALISAVGENCTVTSTNESTTDVTLSYVDTKARLDSLRVEQEQLTELLKQAKDLDSIIVLQNRLTEVRYQIESAESTLRVLENQVTYATLNLRVREVMEIKPQEAPHVDTYGDKIAKTFKNSLKNIAEFFKGLFLVLVAVSPVLVPFIVISVVVVLIIVSSVKKKRKKRAALRAAALAAQNAGAPAPAPQAAAQASQPDAKPGEKKDEKKEEKTEEKSEDKK